MIKQFSTVVAAIVASGIIVSVSAQAPPAVSVRGSGTANTVPKWSSVTGIGNSSYSDVSTPGGVTAVLSDLVLPSVNGSPGWTLSAAGQSLQFAPAHGLIYSSGPFSLFAESGQFQIGTDSVFFALGTDAIARVSTTLNIGSPSGPAPSAGDVNAAGAIKINGVAVTPTGGASVEHISYQPGLLTAVNATKAAFHKFSVASTVDNIEVSAATFSCVANPTVTMYECGTSATCTTPTTIGSGTVSAAGTVVDGTISAPAIVAGDYVAFAISAGTCASIDIAATAQVHVN